MELINKNDNIVFLRITDILNEIIKSGGDFKEECKKRMNSYANDIEMSITDFRQNVLGQYVLNNEKVSDLNNKIIKIRTSAAEKSFISDMLGDTETRIIMGSAAEKLEKAIEGIEILPYGKRIIKNVFSNDTYKISPQVKENILIVMQAIMNKKEISYTNYTNNGIYKGETTPFMFLYSLRDRCFKLIVRFTDNNGGGRIGCMNLERLKNIQITDNPAADDMEKLLEVQKRILKFEVTEERKAHERAFMLFSHLNKRAVHIPSEKKYIIEAVYYKFDEQDIIRDLLSLGSCAVVLEPKEVRESIIDVFKKAINFYEKY